ncbi:MAG: hypothetical protein Q4F65_12570 [Propionibacteriaceae bacterium]|nr:hypothetical protein [Propionibacteriaceae bacterium]
MVKTYRPWHEVDCLRRMVGFHDESRCAGQVCVIHNPTDHHLRHLPLIWRHDRRIFERVCPHGVGHPDPDHLPHWEAMGWESIAVHGCDGCCEETP